MSEETPHLASDGDPPGGRSGGPGARLLIVCGAHLEAERQDRPVAYGLAHRVRSWAELWAESEADPAPLEPIVCTDVWYLNHDRLWTLPTIAIGHPGINALTAHLAGRLPDAFVVNDRLAVQMDPALEEPIAACWGVGTEATRDAVGVFEARYLDPFCQAACARLAPQG